MFLNPEAQSRGLQTFRASPSFPADQKPSINQNLGILMVPFPRTRKCLNFFKPGLTRITKVDCNQSEWALRLNYVMISDNQTPLDRTNIYRKIQLMKISLLVTIAMWLFAAIGVAFSFGFLGFNIRNRQNRCGVGRNCLFLVMFKRYIKPEKGSISREQDKSQDIEQQMSLYYV